MEEAAAGSPAAAEGRPATARTAARQAPQPLGDGPRAPAQAGRADPAAPPRSAAYHIPGKFCFGFADSSVSMEADFPRKVSKKDWRPAGSWLHGDPLPLPLPALPALPHPDALHYVHQRRRRQAQRVQRVNEVARCINRLASASANSRCSFPRNEAAPGARPTALQLDALEHIRSRALSYGGVPEDLMVEGALTELPANKCLYDRELYNLARFDLERLRVAWGDFTPKCAEKLLRPEVSGYLTRFQDCIEMTSEEVEARLAEEPLPQPYWDPVLREDAKQRHDLFKRLIHLKVFSVRRSIKSAVGLFLLLFVKKKKNNDIRMAVDCRRTNAIHRRPPAVKLGSVDAFSDIDLSPLSPASCSSGELAEIQLAASDADLRDGFYQMEVHRIASWFGIEERFLAKDRCVSECWCDDDQQRVRLLKPDEPVFVVAEALCMGWSWALFFCNEVVAECAAEASMWRAGAGPRQGTPASTTPWASSTFRLRRQLHCHRRQRPRCRAGLRCLPRGVRPPGAPAPRVPPWRLRARIPRVALQVP